MEFSKITFAVENGIGLITMNSPKNLNALNEEMIDDVRAALGLCAQDEAVRAVVLTGSGKGFSAGGDIGAMYSSLKADRMDLGDTIKKVGLLALEIKKLPKPVIAAVHGAVAGAGVSIAMACDFCFASEDAKFVEAFVHLGLVPDAAGIYFLTRAMGIPKATELTMTGRPVGAQEAVSLNMINAVVPAEQLMDTVMGYAKKLAQAPANSIAGIKALLFESELKGMEEYLELEVSIQSACGETKDFKEGVYAFVEKRKPVFGQK